MDRVCLCKDSELIDVTEWGHGLRNKFVCVPCGGTQWEEEE